MVADQLVPVEARWFAVGWQHPDAREDTAGLPFSDAISSSKKPYHDQVEVVGNGMHVAQAGVWCLWS